VPLAVVAFDFESGGTGPAPATAARCYSGMAGP